MAHAPSIALGRERLTHAASILHHELVLDCLPSHCCCSCDCDRHDNQGDKGREAAESDSPNVSLLANDLSEGPEDGLQQQLNHEAQDHLTGPSLAECLVTLDYWLLATSFFVIMGAGFTLLNNMGKGTC